MKWLTQKREPDVGSRRTKRKFAVTPTICQEYTIWLESYDSVQEYKCIPSVVNGTIRRDYKWVEIERNPLYDYHI